MIGILIGAGVSGFVLGATSRIVFLLPAALMALVVAAVLIVRADIDIGFTALAASLLNGGFLLGVVMAQLLPRLSRPLAGWKRATPASWFATEMGEHWLASVSTAGRRRTACSPVTKRGGSPLTLESGIGGLEAGARGHD